jgi:hypothetical protein
MQVVPQHQSVGLGYQHGLTTQLKYDSKIEAQLQHPSTNRTHENVEKPRV